MVESLNKRIKYDFLFVRSFQDEKELFKYLPVVVKQYGAKPKQVLHGLTPNEVLGGIIPDPNQFKKDIQQAKAQRIIENQKVQCCIEGKAEHN